ncbi:MAG TPA: GvpL/GvpF family gas vesicle protein [Jatrophihabitans sp.]|jgi:hypothetical protein|nr:GvpL/GvpF family gas vesicle protein [Jatrophihabitans sp.]
MMDTATYLYAITRPVPPNSLEGLRGVADTPVRSIDDGELACLVSTVDLAEFGEDALRANLEDLAWLERTARQHDAVVQAGTKVTTTLPLRLATICSDDASARERLYRLGRVARDTLATLDGREEWGLKLFAPADGARAPEVLATALSGAAYLRRRRVDIEQRDHAAERAVEDADAVFRRLAAHAVEARRHRPQDQRLTGAAQPMVLNAAFLVERERVEQFRDAVAELDRERGDGAVVLTGPWPPYSFVAVDES